MTTNKWISAICMMALILGFCRVPVTSAQSANFQQAVLYFNAMEYKKSESIFVKLQAAGSLTGRQQLETHKYLAQIYVAMQEKEKAIEQFKMILSLESTYYPSEASPSILEAYEEARKQMPSPAITSIPQSQNESNEPKDYSLAGKVFLGLGVAALAGSAICYWRAGVKYGEYEGAEDEDEAEAARDTGRSYETYGMTAAGTGLVLIGAGIYFIASAPDKSASSSGSPQIFVGAATTFDQHGAVFGATW